MHELDRETIRQLSQRSNGRGLGQLGAHLTLLAASGTAVWEKRNVAETVPVGDVIGVYDACRAAEFHCINFAATPDEVAPVTSRQAAKVSPRHPL